MVKKRILYVTHEIEPFVKESDTSSFIKSLAKEVQEEEYDVRILMPRFGLINERKNRLHEVKRLSGINLHIGNEEWLLIIKVASIPGTKLQVYFIDNEDFFKRKTTLYNKDGQFFDDNHIRMLFFGQGVLTTVMKLGWVPDIIHCFNWMTSMIPMFVKTTHKTEPIFKNSKLLFTLSDVSFKEKLNDDFIEKLKHYELPQIIMDKIDNLDYNALINMVSTLSDTIVTADKTSQTLLENKKIAGNIKHLPYNSNSIALYKEIYEKLYEQQ